MDPHAREAAAAIAAMQDTYGAPPTGFAVGERVTYRSADGSQCCRAVVIEVLDELVGTYHIAIHEPGRQRTHRIASDHELAPF